MHPGICCARGVGTARSSLSMALLQGEVYRTEYLPVYTLCEGQPRSSPPNWRKRTVSTVGFIFRVGQINFKIVSLDVSSVVIAPDQIDHRDFLPSLNNLPGPYPVTHSIGTSVSVRAPPAKLYGDYGLIIDLHLRLRHFI